MPLELSFKHDLIDFLTGQGTLTPPSQWYLGMLVGTAEIGGTWYGRQTVNFNAASSGYATSSNEVQFNMVTSQGDTVDTFGLWDSLSGPESPLVTSGSMNPSTIALNVGIVVKIPAGTIRYY